MNVKASIKSLKTGKVTFQIFRQLPHDTPIVVGKRISNWQLVIAVEPVQEHCIYCTTPVDAGVLVCPRCQ